MPPAYSYDSAVACAEFVDIMAQTPLVSPVWRYDPEGYGVKYLA